jgi:ubiquinone/menaquinone biosynthesis C-methylase UbiE
LLIEVIEHAWQPEAMIAEIARILLPQGRLVLTTSNYPIKRAYDWLSYFQGVRPSPADDPTHFSPFSARGIRKLCRRYFTTVESQINRVAGEGRLPVLAHLKSIPSVGDLVGHKITVFCRQPLGKGL